MSQVGRFMDKKKLERLARWRRTLCILFIVHLVLLLVMKAPISLAVARHVWLFYLLKLQSRPLLVKSLTSATGFALGDGVAQSLQKQREYSLPRTTRFATFGLLLHGPACHYFYHFVDALVQPSRATSASAVLTKVALERILLTPFLLCSLFVFLALVEHRLRGFRISGTLRQIWEIWLLSNIVWPLAHCFNFAVLPPEQRVLFVNIVSVCWNVVLCEFASNSAERHRRPELAPLALRACAGPAQLGGVQVHVAAAY